MGRLRHAISCILALSLATPHAALSAAGGGDAITKAEYEACQTQDDAAFRSSVQAITQNSLTRSLSKFDYAVAVADAWRSTGMDETLDKRVDLAVAEVSSITSWGDLLQSLADTQKAQELAKAVAERVYKSEDVKKGIEAVIADVARTLGLSLEFATQDAAGPAIACVKAFLGRRYGSAVSAAVTGQAEKEFAIDSGKGQASVTGGAVVAQSRDGIAGAAILLLRRQLANMASRIGQRIAGSVLSRLVSVAAGVVGAVLIAKDIWELRTGVLPIIATEMKSKATKDLVQAELAKSIAEQIGEHIKELSAKTSDRIVEIWQEFRRAHAKSLEIAERSEAFRKFLDETAPAKLPRLDEIVGLLLASEGEGSVLKRLADGTLTTAVNVLAPSAIDIARETRSLETGIKWAAIAGDALPRVLEQELHRRASPDDFTKASLGRLLAMDDRLVIQRLASISREAREVLFDIDQADLKQLGRTLAASELTTLARYLTGLEAKARERVLRTVSREPARMKVLASARVRDGVLASRDQSFAVDMMLRAGAGTGAEIVSDYRKAFDGQISPVLLWERHPVVTLLGLIPLLVLLLVLRRIFMPRKPRAAVPQAAQT